MGRKEGLSVTLYICCRRVHVAKPPQHVWSGVSKPHTPRSRRRAGADEGCVIGWFLDAADKHRHQVL